MDLQVVQIRKRSEVIVEENKTVISELQTVKNNLFDLNERHLDLQMRTVRDNLIFDGIPEAQEEDIEAVLKEFIHTVMGIEEGIQFHRVHRLGRKIPNKHRPIIAKFVLFKERERVRREAPATLVGKPFGVNEQYPKAINDRRKLLYPHYKQAKRQNRKAVMVADKLFVDNVRVYRSDPLPDDRLVPNRNHYAPAIPMESAPSSKYRSTLRLNVTLPSASNPELRVANTKTRITIESKTPDV
ncbi:uncharacterized protein LOC134245151 [Saccostrea cucullata]|uniref:uncharacterized protein LOC134245151 n=1 Tax=Saccostrea cuccullata TaxID=36930 RepID=UPI002ED454E6